MERGKVLLIDDEPILLVTVSDALAKAGYTVEMAENGQKGLMMFQEGSFDIVLLDMVMPDISGMDILREMKGLYPQTIVVMITAHGTIEKAVEAMKLGVHDFIAKPFSLDELILKLQNISSFQCLKEENVYLRQQLEKKYHFGNLIGKSHKMQEIYELIKTVSQTDSTVLIQGESGTGKELVANAIHFNSRRKNDPFIKVSCAALSETILESELFGHEKGAFTGAIQRKLGRFELANKGTLFLDEIGDISPTVQVKLLRVLQEREFERVGGTKTVHVDVRIISATKYDMDEIKTERLREDLYYRLNTITIQLPCLLERKEDIPLLAKYFFNEFRGRTSKSILGFTEGALDLLEQYEWPGNIRELKNVVERAVAICRTEKLQIADLPQEIREIRLKKKLIQHEIETLNNVLKAVEKEYLQKILRITQGRKAEAADLLGISRKTLWEKIKEHQMSDKSPS
ncbi:MAG: sigma-54-dependent Fis family transcriptional regulator [Desulfobacterales bacterium]|nr:sigma-54-dependent Fis family transcriptional regulator [Desulfobacterales bacterium]